MKILVQKLKDGSVQLLETPAPLLADGCIRVRTLFSAISPGTEGNKIATGRMSLIGKARAKPEQVRMVVGMVGQIGLSATIQKVRDKLDGAGPLGYSLAGEVVAVAAGIQNFEVGELVACAGGGYANHAEEVVVPVNLAVKVPSGVSAEAASMTTLGAIALQGIRRAKPTLGEGFMVVGLGPIGIMTCELLKAHGCRVLATDISASAVDRARALGVADLAVQLGVDPVETAALNFSRGQGVDAVLICAATASSDPVKMAGRLCRQRGRVVVVGAVGMDLPRENYYEKELQFTVSCSYGPGRYDPLYEECGLDYPYGFVRWTEGRNMEATLDMMAADRFHPERLVTHRFSLADAPDAYEMIATRREPYCGILVQYPAKQENALLAVPLNSRPAHGPKNIGIGFVGAGNFAQTFLLPSFRDDSRTTLGPIFTRTGLTATDVGQRHGFTESVASAESVISHNDTDAVVIATRHDQHGTLVEAALRGGKHVFVEKPLCLRRERLKSIARIARELGRSESCPILQVGFNRRFSPAAVRVKEHFGRASGPLTMIYRVSAGHIPRSHWTQDPREGGGRIVGEVCHFIDLMQFLCGADPISVSAMCITTQNQDVKADDNVVINLKFGDGSVGSIGYFAEGAEGMPKEQCEVLGAGRSAIIHNFKKVTLMGRGKTKQVRCAGKGHKEEVVAFLRGIENGVAPIPIVSQLATTLATFQILDSLANNCVNEVQVASLVPDHD